MFSGMPSFFSCRCGCSNQEFRQTFQILFRFQHQWSCRGATNLSKQGQGGYTFKNTGADWLSPRPIVENPYYGSRMFSCGDVTETLSLPAKFSPQPNEHSGHKHTP